MKYIFQIHLEKLKESPFVKHLTLTSSVYKMKHTIVLLIFTALNMKTQMKNKLTAPFYGRWGFLVLVKTVTGKNKSSKK